MDALCKQLTSLRLNKDMFVGHEFYWTAFDYLCDRLRTEGNFVHSRGRAVTSLRASIKSRAMAAECKFVAYFPPLTAGNSQDVFLAAAKQHFAQRNQKLTGDAMTEFFAMSGLFLLSFAKITCPNDAMHMVASWMERMFFTDPQVIEHVSQCGGWAFLFCCGE